MVCKRWSDGWLWSSSTFYRFVHAPDWRTIRMIPITFHFHSSLERYYTRLVKAIPYWFWSFFGFFSPFYLKHWTYDEEELGDRFSLFYFSLIGNYILIVFDYASESSQGNAMKSCSVWNFENRFSFIEKNEYLCRLYNLVLLCQNIEGIIFLPFNYA